MSLTLPYPILGVGIADSTKIDSNNNSIATKFGNIDNSDIKASAGIDISKLSASYEYMVVPLTVAAGSAASANTWAVAPLDAVTIVNDGKGNWTVVDVSWLCTDTGDGLAQFRLKWAYYTGGAITGVTNIIAATLITNATAIVQGNVALSATTLTFDGNQRSLILTGEVDSATTLDTANSFFKMSVLLKRQIAS